MKILNVRLDFAHNSSSSHSLLLLENNETIPADDGISTDGYHWETFTLSDPESKAHYFQTQLLLALQGAGAGLYIKELFNLNPQELESLSQSTIDHQSVWSFPTQWDGKSVHLGFVQEFFEYVKNNQNLIVLGGNDNGGEHPLEKEDRAKNFSIDSLGLSRFVAVKDELGDSWILFNRSTGHRIRLSFKDANPFVSIQSQWEESSQVNSNLPMSVPALVDIKITDFCPYGCEYCYQGSTPQGQHAKLENLAKVALEFGQKNVFEVALGGGETTLHPQFKEVLELFHYQKIAVNFTTRNKAWLNKKDAKDILKMVGGVAFSVDTLEELKEIVGLFEKLQDSRFHDKASVLSFQIVPGALDEKEVEKIIDFHVESMKNWKRFGLTFLGFKETGFGQDFLKDSSLSIEQARAKEIKALDYASKKARVDKNKYIQVPIHIDTTLAKTASAWLDKNKIPPSVFHFLEGTSSMYLDATKMEMGVSSYAPESMVAFDENWVDVFQKNAIQAFHGEFKKKIKISLG